MKKNINIYQLKCYFFLRFANENTECIFHLLFVFSIFRQGISFVLQFDK